MLEHRNQLTWFAIPTGSSTRFPNSFLEFLTLDAVKGAFTKPIAPATPPTQTSLRGNNFSTLAVLDRVLAHGLSLVVWADSFSSSLGVKSQDIAWLPICSGVGIAETCWWTRVVYNGIVWTKGDG